MVLADIFQGNSAILISSNFTLLRIVSLFYTDLRRSWRCPRHDNIPNLSGGGVPRRRLLPQASRQDLHLANRCLPQLDRHYDTYAHLPEARPLDGQHGKSTHAKRVRVELHL